MSENTVQAAREERLSLKFGRGGFHFPAPGTRTNMTGAPVNETAKDACDELNAQNQLILEMLEIWDRRTEQLEGRDDVDDRWERGSAGKVLLQHLAARETAIADITDPLKDVGQPNLAASLEGDGVERRQASTGSFLRSFAKTVFELWPTQALSGELSQELPMSSHFEQATAVVTQDMVAEAIPCGPDPKRHLDALREYVDAGCDELFISQSGDDAQGFFEFFNGELRPELGPLVSPDCPPSALHCRLADLRERRGRQEDGPAERAALRHLGG